MAITRREAVRLGAGILPFVGLTTVSFADDDNPKKREDVGHMNMDVAIASCMLIKDRRQFDVCRYALDRLQQAECKNLCRTVLEGVENCKNKLAQLGYEFPTKSTERGIVTASGTDNSARDQAIFFVGTRNRIPLSHSKMVGIELELLDQCVKTTKSELARHQGGQFDKCFVGDQLHCHLAAHDHMVVARRHAGTELARLMDDARPKCEQNIQTCRTLLESLDAGKG